MESVFICGKLFSNSDRISGFSAGDMACHVVLWIPTIVYQGFSDKESFIEKNISDIPGKELMVKVSLHSGGNIQVDVKSNNGEYNPFVTLIREDVSSNGLMCFTYKSTSDDGKGFCFTTTEFPTAIYHIIKDFYHKHEFHDGENDSSLRPFVSSHKINIKAKDNEALLHYLTTYGTVISNFVSYIQLAIRAKRAAKDKINPDTRELLNDMCLRARGYEVYMGVLYRSKYNTKCRPDNMIDRELRHIACNIENGLRYIRLIEHEFGEYTQESFVSKMIKDANNSIRSSKLSIRIGWGSIAVGIISLIVSLIISARSTKGLYSVKDGLQQQLDSIPVYLQNSERREREIASKEDEISIRQQSFEDRLKRMEYQLNSIVREKGE